MLRLGIVDFDSSHSIEFTRRINHVAADPDQYVDGARIVLGYPGTSTMSSERIPTFTQQLRTCGIDLVESPEEMIGQIDAVLVLSLCGTAHLNRVRPFLEARIPAFVDKPFACSVADAQEMLRLSQEHDTLLFSSSGLRYTDDVLRFAQSAPRYGAVHGVISYGPAKYSEGNPGLFHYGIHATELLFTLMGPGCVRVATVGNESVDVCTAWWNDGRVATLRGIRQGATAYGFTAFCEHGVITQDVSTRYAYRNLCRAIIEAFQSGRAPVAIEHTLEIVKFISAANESRQHAGQPVELDR